MDIKCLKVINIREKPPNFGVFPENHRNYPQIWRKSRKSGKNPKKGGFPLLTVPQNPTKKTPEFKLKHVAENDVLPKTTCPPSTPTPPLFPGPPKSGVSSLGNARFLPYNRGFSPYNSDIPIIYEAFHHLSNNLEKDPSVMLRNSVEWCCIRK